MRRSPLPRRAAPLPRTSMKPQGVSMKSPKPVPVQPQDPSTLAPRLAQGPKRVAKPLGATTAKKRAYEAELDALRAEVLERSHGVCEARLPGCVRLAPTRFRKGVEEAVNLHHRLGRGSGGRNTMLQLVHCCVVCHKDGIHVTHHALARSWGLLLHAGDDPEAILVRRWPPSPRPDMSEPDGQLV